MRRGLVDHWRIPRERNGGGLIAEHQCRVSSGYGQPTVRFTGDYRRSAEGYEDFLGDILRLVPGAEHPHRNADNELAFLPKDLMKIRPPPPKM